MKQTLILSSVVSLFLIHPSQSHRAEQQMLDVNILISCQFYHIKALALYVIRFRSCAIIFIMSSRRIAPVSLSSLLTYYF